MKGDIIPDNELLFKYVNPLALPEDQEEIPYGIFEDKELSCDWAKHQKKPEFSFHIREGKNVIIQITVCDAIRFPCNPTRPRQKQPAWEQEIIHDPISKGADPKHLEEDNFSHSLIKGLKKIHITKAIASNSKKYKVVDLSFENSSKSQFPSALTWRNNFSAKAIIIIAFCLILILILFYFLRNNHS